MVDHRTFATIASGMTRWIVFVHRTFMVTTSGCCLAMTTPSSSSTMPWTCSKTLTQICHMSSQVLPPTNPTCFSDMPYVITCLLETLLAAAACLSCQAGLISLSSWQIILCRLLFFFTLFTFFCSSFASCLKLLCSMSKLAKHIAMRQFHRDKTSALNTASLT